MRAKLLLVLVPALMLASCGGQNLMNSSLKSEEQSVIDTSSENPTETKVIVDYQHDGGANIPTDWDDNDTSDTARQGNYVLNTASSLSFAIDFVGKWHISNKNQELQCKKSPVSYIRAASNYVVTTLVVEVFKADFAVYRTKDHIGTKLEGTKVDAAHSDGEAYSFTVDSKDWSILPTETYQGTTGTINIYSITFYF